MAQSISIAGASYPDVPSIECPKTGGGTAVFYDASIATATAAEILSGYTAFGATGLLTGTASGGGGAARTPRVPQQSVTTNSSRQAILQNGTGSIVDDDYYVVTYDGVEYLCTSNVLWTNNYVIGDPVWATTTTNDYIYPFAIVYYSGTYYFFSTTASATHTIKVEHIDISGGGGGSNWELIASKEFTTSTSSTTQTTLGYIDLDSLPSGDYIIMVHVRDKAGPRSGYFYGTDSFWLVNNGTRPNNANPNGFTILYSNNAYSISTSMRGIYPYNINTSLQIQMNQRYASSTSGTINGTYKCEIYKLTAPTGSPFFVR